MSGETQYRISVVAAVVLVGFAVVADLIGLIPIAKDFTATIFWIAAGAYLYTKGIKLWNGKRVAATAISWVASLIPVIQELPVEITAGIIAVIIITRIEDKTGLSVLKPLASGQPLPPPPLVQGGVRAPSGPAPAPLNEDGVRRPSAPAYGEDREEGVDGPSPRQRLSDFGQSRSRGGPDSEGAPASSTYQRSTNYTASYTGSNAPSVGSTTSQPSSASAGTPSSTTSNSASSGGGAASGSTGSGGGAGASGGGGGGGK